MNRNRLQFFIAPTALACAVSSSCSVDAGVDQAKEFAADTDADTGTDTDGPFPSADATSGDEADSSSRGEDEDASSDSSSPGTSGGRGDSADADGGDDTEGTETAGGFGELTDRTFESFTAEGHTSDYHLFVEGLDWSKSVGLMVYTDGSGGYGFDDPTRNYLLDSDGSNGLVSVARKHNLVLLVPEAPSPGCDGYDNCWYDPQNAPSKARWSSALITHIKSLYDVDSDRIVIGGYSSGAQWTTRYFLPAHGENHSVDLAVAIAYGGAPAVTPNFSDEYKESTVVSFDTGTADEAYTSSSWGARGGYNWYTEAGFTTDAIWPQGVGHGRSGEFAGIMDREISKYLAPAS